MKRSITLLILGGAILLAILFCWREQQPLTIKRSRMIMGTLVEISVTGRDGMFLHQQVDAAFAEMERLERLFSPHVEGSEVARLAKTSVLAVSAETRDVIAAGLDVAKRSRGAFDITLGRLVDIWDINAVQPHVPSPAMIEEALRGIGPEALIIEGRRVTKQHPWLKPELGGVAKGYAAAAAARLLSETSIESGAVNAGGDMALVGRPAGRDWRIGIRHPREADNLLATLVIPGGAVATSGDYERYFESAGQRYHHLFDPRTGYPARGCQSVTVWAADATYADALATAAFVLGPKQGLEMLEGWPGVEGLLVTSVGEVVMTRGMQERVEWP